MEGVDAAVGLSGGGGNPHCMHGLGKVGSMASSVKMSVPTDPDRRYVFPESPVLLFMKPVVNILCRHTRDIFPCSH